MSVQKMFIWWLNLNKFHRNKNEKTFYKMFSGDTLVLGKFIHYSNNFKFFYFHASMPDFFLQK